MIRLAQPQPFQYGYAIDSIHPKDQSKIQHSRQEVSDGQELRGSYQIHLPDGRVQTVEYTSGVGGYRAEVKYDSGSPQLSNSPVQQPVQQPVQPDVLWNAPNWLQQNPVTPSTFDWNQVATTPAPWDWNQHVTTPAPFYWNRQATTPFSWNADATPTPAPMDWKWNQQATTPVNWNFKMPKTTPSWMYEEAAIESRTAAPHRSKSERKRKGKVDPSVFQFGYDVDEFDHRNREKVEHSRTEVSDGKERQGSYQIRLPDGRLQIVTYTAGVNGYKADITYEGTASEPAVRTRPTPNPRPRASVRTTQRYFESEEEDEPVTFKPPMRKHHFTPTPLRTTLRYAESEEEDEPITFKPPKRKSFASTTVRTTRTYVESEEEDEPIVYKAPSSRTAAPPIEWLEEEPVAFKSSKYVDSDEDQPVLFKAPTFKARAKTSAPSVAAEEKDTVIYTTMRSPMKQKNIEPDEEDVVHTTRKSVRLSDRSQLRKEPERIEIESEEETTTSPLRSFRYKYDVDELHPKDKSKVEHSKSETSIGKEVMGEWMTRLDDGRIQIVKYTAGVEGFKADITYEGTATEGPKISPLLLKKSRKSKPEETELRRKKEVNPSDGDPGSIDRPRVDQEFLPILDLSRSAEIEPHTEPTIKVIPTQSLDGKKNEPRMLGFPSFTEAKRMTQTKLSNSAALPIKPASAVKAVDEPLTSIKPTGEVLPPSKKMSWNLRKKSEV